MVNSMTGFAALNGALSGQDGDQNGASKWRWEARSVNARGLDLRLRLPEGLGDLESVLRKALQARLVRGSVSVGLRVQRATGDSAATLDSGQLAMVLRALKQVEEAAGAHDLHLTASSAADILALRGVLDGAVTTPASEAAAEAALMAALKADIAPLINALCATRASEGAALLDILLRQLGAIDTLLDAAGAAIGDRHQAMAETLRANLARVLDNSEGADETRLMQELAILAVKADIAEELDRLRAHVTAARALLAAGAEQGPIGRKFDFLTQEFMREANTLCSKSGNAALTRIGLDLKTVIDQMREQVQNVE